ncbi:MAG: UTP--glucose-1-phosphate uridylyltransferase GalU [Verrucomicrobia bacterium]|nr:UTP--glucose-1-phosphate uridylyltransferase GalU [Verrucomicrobiota bacterium]
MIKKAVIPAAGFGTRFLPASKSVPKEMIPVVDKPTIQYVVEEAVEAGIEEILIIVSSGKDAIKEHFASNIELEAILEKKGKVKELKCVQSLSHLAHIQYTNQLEMKGLGDAVLCAKEFAGKDPVAILLGDTIIRSKTEHSALQSMVKIHDKHGGSVIALRKMPRSKISQYGVVSGKELGEGVIEIDHLVEKPEPDKAPSLLAVSARYIVTPKIFEFLENTQPGFGGEIQITDALNALAKEERMFGFQFDGSRLDIGNKLEFIKSNVILGLEKPDIRDDLMHFLKELAIDS